MRVLTVARWYPSHDSPGRGSFVADLVRATSAAGIESRVVSFDRVLVRGPVEERDGVLRSARAAYERVATPEALFGTPGSFGAPGVPVARLPLVRRPGSGDSAALIEDHLVALEPFVRRLVVTWRPDVIHAHTGLPDGIVAAEVGRALGIPVVVTEHMSTIEAELADPVALERYRGLLGPGVRLLGVSPSLASRVAALLGVGADAIGVLPNPVPDGSFPPAEAAGRHAGELLWVGSIGEHKGIHVLLAAFAQIRARRPAVRLRLVGGERTGGERGRWEELAGSLGVSSAVTFEGWLPREQVARTMAGAGVFVHPSPSETFGVAAAEAVLTGLPVAARQSGGVPWIVELSGGFGRVADDEGPEAFARAIEAVLDGDVAVDAPTARQRLVDAIGEAAVARQAIDCYEQTIAAGTSRYGAVPSSAAAAGDVSTLATLTAPPARDAQAVIPRVLVATGPDQAFKLVAALPVPLQQHLTLVLPPRVGPAPDDSPARPELAVRIVEARSVPPAKPRPRGRSPLARIRRALWRPAPTAEQLFAGAILAEARRWRSRRAPVEIVAVDAPAAAVIERLEARRARLAPGSLRWLADRWDAESGTGG